MLAATGESEAAAARRASWWCAPDRLCFDPVAKMAGLRGVCMLLEKHRDVICEDLNVDEVVPELVNKGILGVDYVEHVILQTDTLPGICLAYKVSASRIKRANHFTGESLLLAPKKLVIPISKKAMQQGYLRVQDTDCKEYKIHAIQAECPTLGLTEAKA